MSSPSKAKKKAAAGTRNIMDFFPSARKTSVFNKKDGTTAPTSPKRCSPSPKQERKSPVRKKGRSKSPATAVVRERKRKLSKSSFPSDSELTAYEGERENGERERETERVREAVTKRETVRKRETVASKEPQRKERKRSQSPKLAGKKRKTRTEAETPAIASERQKSPALKRKRLAEAEESGEGALDAFRLPPPPGKRVSVFSAGTKREREPERRENVTPESVTPAVKETETKKRVTTDNDDNDDDVSLLPTPPGPPSKLRKLRESSMSPRKEKAPPRRSPTRTKSPKRTKSPTKSPVRKKKSKSPKRVAGRGGQVSETSMPPPFVASPKKAPAPAAAPPATSASPSKGGGGNWRQYQNRGPPKAKGSKEVPKGATNCLLNSRFIITGVLESLERDEATRLIQDHGGTVMKTIGVHLNYAVVGDAPGPGKMKKIEARNAMADKSKHITILDEDALFDLIRSSPAQQLSEKQRKALAKKNAPAKVSVAKPVGGATSGVPSNGGADGTESQLWTDKYRPISCSDLVGNPGAIKQVRAFLAKWKAGKVGSKDKRALLISGDPGIGKTSAALLIAKDMGFETVEFNASDTRSKKAIDLHISSLLGNRTITSMFAPKHKAANDTDKNKVLIMDEVDGMSGSDRGGIAELIKLIKTTRTPIICICNDRQSTKIRSLRNYCEQISWRKIMPQQAVPRLLGIAKNEKLDITSELAHKIATLANGDMRQMLNSLQMFRVSKRHMHSSDVERMEKKQTSLNVFECIPQLLGQQTQQRASMMEKLDLYFVDMSLTPLFMQENYIKATPAVVQQLRQRPAAGGVPPVQVALHQHLQCLSSAAESISDGDLVDEATRTNQSWSLIPYHGVLSTVRPGWFMQGGLGGMQAFPSWLGKFSTTRKNERLLTDVRTRMAAVTRADLPATLLEYMPLMRRSLVNPLLRQDTDRVQELFDIMETYRLTKDDWDSIMAVTKLSNMTRDPFAWIPEKTMKEFGKLYTRAHYREKDGFTKKKTSSAKAAVLDEFGDLVIEAETDEDTDSELPNSDKLIKIKKPRKPRAAGKKKAAAPRAKKAAKKA